MSIAADDRGGARAGDSPGARALFKRRQRDDEADRDGNRRSGLDRGDPRQGLRRPPADQGLHLCEIDKARLERGAKETGPGPDDRLSRAAGPLRHRRIIVSTTPETTHYPFTRDCLMARKHVLLEKPIGLELKHADELMQLAGPTGFKLTIATPSGSIPLRLRQAVRGGRHDRPAGDALSAATSSRSIGNKIGGRVHSRPRSWKPRTTSTSSSGACSRAGRSACTRRTPTA